MKFEVDNYILEYSQAEDKYYIYFTDGEKQEQKIEITKEIFDIYRESKKAYTKIKNETSRHLEQSDLTEGDIHNRKCNSENSIEEQILKNVEKIRTRQAMKNLTEAQYRRINLHILKDMSIRDIAKLEKVRKGQIEKSLKSGIKKLKKFFLNRVDKI